MENEDKQGKLFEALSAAQALIKGAIKDSTNPFFKSSYADLQSVWDACRDALSKNGLCIIQSTEFVEGKVCVKTILGHKDGGSIIGILPIKAKDESAQSQGSGISYARRYALAAMVGVYQTDDDAEGATHHEKPNGAKVKVGTTERPAEKRDAELDEKIEIQEKPLTKDKFVALIKSKLGAGKLGYVQSEMTKQFKNAKYDLLTDDQKLTIAKWVKDHSEMEE